jgi:hypothetical protein
VYRRTATVYRRAVTVTSRVEDGERIGELLASEVTGSERSPLGRVTVVDAREAAEPSPGGTFAYGLALDAEAVDGDGIDGSGDGPVRLVDAFLLPDRVRLDVRAGREALPPDDDRLTVRGGDPPAVFVASGGAVKPAVDLVATLVRAVDRDDRS